MGKLKCIASALAAVALFTALAQGQGNPVKATVPFEFRVGTRTLPAGDYVIRASEAGNFLQLRALRSGDTVPVLIGSTEGSRVAPKLDFTQVQGHKFLSGVSTGSVAYGFAVPRDNRQLARVIVPGNSGE